MAFEFGYTCGEIDSCIDTAKAELEAGLENLLEIACPLLEGDLLNKTVKEHLDSIFSEIKPSFEAVRTLNENMRTEAEKQIDNLEEELMEKDNEKQLLQDEINELQERIDNGE